MGGADQPWNPGFTLSPGVPPAKGRFQDGLSAADGGEEVDFAIVCQWVLHPQAALLAVDHEDYVRAEIVPVAEPVPDTGVLRLQATEGLSHRPAGDADRGLAAR